MKGKIRTKTTYSPSKFSYRFSDSKYYITEELVENSDKVRLYHFYITAPGEIGLNDKWHINPSGLVRKEFDVNQDFWKKRHNYNTIVMTSDPELIADGIQELDTRFMFWFLDGKPGYIDLEEGEDGKYKLMY
jgi:hypothetical protein